MAAGSTVSSPESTGGKGYSFEDHAFAYFLLCLLAERTALEARCGPPVEVLAQTEVDGWTLDDALLKHSASGGASRAAVSVKSGEKYAHARAPTSFVEAAWKLYLSPGATGFSADRDLLVLATGSVSAARLENMREVIRRAACQPAKLLDARIGKAGWANADMREFYASFACPAALAKEHPKADTTPGGLLRAIRLIDYDFLAPASRSESAAIDLCRLNVRNHSAQAARGLWDSLLRLANSGRSAGCAYDLAGLALALRDDHSLLEAANRACWEDLRRWTDAWRRDIRVELGAGVHIRRTEQTGAIRSQLRATDTLVLTGPSGSGKSGLLRELSEEVAPEELVVAGKATSLAALVNPAGGSEPWSGKSLEQVLVTRTSPTGILVLDEFEGVRTEAARERLRVLCKALQLGEPGSGWKLVVACQLADREGLDQWLASLGDALGARYELGTDGFAAAEIQEVVGAYPGLEPLFERQGTAPLVRLPHILNLIVLALEAGADWSASTPVSEALVVDQYWRRVIEQGEHARSRSAAFERIAVSTAAGGGAPVPVSTLADEQRDRLDGLERCGAVHVRDQHIQLTHSRLADYALQRHLMGHSGDALVSLLAEKIKDPRWHLAIRLLGQHSLDVRSDLESWVATLDGLQAQDATRGAAADAWLESVVFSSNSAAHLSALEDRLLQDRGTLLGRLLTRCLYSASHPDPRMTAIAQSIGLPHLAATTPAYRILDSHVAAPVIRWIHSRLETIALGAPRPVIDLCRAWLRDIVTRPPFPLESEAGEIALRVATWGAERSGYATNLRGKDAIAAMGCALQAVRSFPEEVAELCRELAGRVPYEKPPEDDGSRHFYGPMEPAAPWPDGPTRRPDSDFQEVMLKGSEWGAMLRLQPALLEELLRAVLIEPPHSRPAHGWPGKIGFGLDDDFHFHAPFWDRGPFFAMLAAARESGLRVILPLIRLATENWRLDLLAQQEGEEPGPTRAVQVTVRAQPETVVLIGDERVFRWSRCCEIAPHSVETMLMALEKWLHDLADKEELSEALALRLLRESRSASVLGVLLAVAQRKPGTLRGPLEFLVRVPELYLWSRADLFENQSSTAMISWTSKHWDDIQRAQLWHRADFRKQSLEQLALEAWVNSKGSWDALEKAIAMWSSSPDDAFAVSRDFVDRVAAYFDPSNWAEQDVGDGRIAFAFVEPEALRKAREPEANAAKQRLTLTTFPFRCRQIIDGNAVLENEDIDAFVAEARRLAPQVETSEVGQVYSQADFLCGMAAVLVLRCPAHLAEHDALAAEATHQLTAVWREPPTRPLGDFRQAIGDWRWDDFASEATPRLLWANPDDHGVREAAAACAAGIHADAAASFFRAARREIEAPDDIFRGLVYLGLRLARLAHLRRLLSRFDITEIPWREEFEHVVGYFISGNSPDLPTDWAEFAGRWLLQSAEPDSWKATERSSSGLAQDHLTPVLAWIPDALASGLSDWISFGLECTGRLQDLIAAQAADRAAQEDERHWEGPLPHEFERSAAKIGALGALTASDPGDRARCMAPLLGVARVAPRFTSSLLNSIFLEGVRSEVEERVVLGCAEYAFEELLAAHDRETEKRHWLTDELLSGVVGQDSWFMSIWSEERAPLVETLWNLLEKWARTALPKPGCLRRFVNFLATDAAKAHRRAGIILIRNAGGSAASLESGGRARLAELLRDLWMEERRAVESAGDLRDAFSSLLQDLVDRQESVALVLAAEFGRP